MPKNKYEAQTTPQILKEFCDRKVPGIVERGWDNATQDDDIVMVLAVCLDDIEELSEERGRPITPRELGPIFAGRFGYTLKPSLCNMIEERMHGPYDRPLSIHHHMLDPIASKMVSLRTETEARFGKSLVKSWEDDMEEWVKYNYPGVAFGKRERQKLEKYIEWQESNISDLIALD